MNWDSLVHSDADTISPTQITGFRYSDGWARNQKVYFATKLSRPAARIERTDIPYTLDTGQECKSVSYGVILRLYYNKVRAGESITLCTALSGVSKAGALKNLQAEAPHTDFNRYRQAATHRWDKRLAQIRLSPDTPDSLQTTFYTALYRAQICPTLYSDVDGRYLGADREIHQRAGGTYSTFSLWDTYRAAHPLYSILQPNLQRDFVQSLIDFGEQNEGHLPVWNMFASETDMMIGYHSVPVIVEAVLRGIYVPKDKAKLLRLLRTTAERKGYRGLDDYCKKGYVASDREDESVSKTSSMPTMMMLSHAMPPGWVTTKWRRSTASAPAPTATSGMRRRASSAPARAMASWIASSIPSPTPSPSPRAMLTTTSSAYSTISMG